jgi:hypothetical protein
MTALHFVGFKGNEYVRATRVFGTPDFIHPGFDLRALREICAGDTVVFANNCSTTPRRKSYSDLKEGI